MAAAKYHYRDGIRTVLQRTVANFDVTAEQRHAALGALADWDDTFIAEHYEATGGDCEEIAQLIYSTLT